MVEQVNPTAHETYLRGMHFLHAGEVDTARVFFQKSIDASPDFALAYAGMANYFSLLPFYGNSSPLEVYPRAKTMALKALELDPNLADAYAVKGLLESKIWQQTRIGRGNIEA